MCEQTALRGPFLTSGEDFLFELFGIRPCSRVAAEGFPTVVLGATKALVATLGVTEANDSITLASRAGDNDRLRLDLFQKCLILSYALC